MLLRIAMLSIHTSPLANPGQTKDAGGMNVYIRELARELAKQNILIDIFTRWTDEQVPQIVQLAPNARVIHIKAGPLAPIHKDELYQYTPTFARHIDEFRRREGNRYDVIHSHYWLSGVAAMRLACTWGIPHITMFHTLARLKQQANPAATEPPLRLEMEQRLIHHVDRIIAATADERTQLMRSCGGTDQQVEVIPCGVDLQLFTPQSKKWAREQLGLPEEQPLLLFAGRLDPFKGPDVLLHAARLMQKKTHVVIVGGQLEGDRDLEQLRHLAEELQLSSRVHFLGARPRAEMPLLYSAVDVTVVPSYHESFGLAAVESLACGTPVVATRAGGLTTVIQHSQTGFLVPRNPGFFAERLDLLLSDPELAARMSAAARSSILKFGWESVASQMRELYEDMVEEGRCLVAL
ncbi:glycosyltransferase [Tengunoibacter tsumagoiensis]|uniref:Glycosyl transferase family 1 n=1 Tax=Tengunoibacter tsumagoiensis TaxID=2014871 RepID=A0A401ZXU7_9CHLR|nr:glycosyltransferase [Tengunoibacter tsumagoiensis]GCE11660.1 glycosyl transferase family 1 [Tengunoibacter tsumagoiensis]